MLGGFKCNDVMMINSVVQYNKQYEVYGVAGCRREREETVTLTSKELIITAIFVSLP